MLRQRPHPDTPPIGPRPRVPAAAAHRVGLGSASARRPATPALPAASRSTTRNTPDGLPGAAPPPPRPAGWPSAALPASYLAPAATGGTMLLARSPPGQAQPALPPTDSK